MQNVLCSKFNYEFMISTNTACPYGKHTFKENDQMIIDKFIYSIYIFQGKVTFISL